MVIDGPRKDRKYGIPVKPVRFPKEGNPLYPLPPDYNELTEDGRRLARVNAMSLRDTVEDRVIAWTCLRDWYLLRMPQGMWYKPPVFPDCPLHYAMIHDLHAYGRSVQVFPRSFGKSIKIDEFCALSLLTLPFFRISLIKSNYKFAEKSVLQIKKLLSWEGIIEDFGYLKPKKGHGKWSNDYLVLANGAEIMATSVMSPQLGPHPNIWIMDDAEFDPKMRVSPALLTENTANLLQEQLIPQLDEGCSGHIVGTLNTVRMLIYRMARTPESEDPTLAYWHRVIYAAYDERGNLTWPEKFSEERLEAMRGEMTPSAYAAAVLNQPSTNRDRCLVLHPRLSSWAIENQDEEYRTAPLKSNATLVSWKSASSSDSSGSTDGPVEKVSRPFGQTIQRMYRVVLVDPCKNPGPGSDYAALLVVGHERSADYSDTLWLLDIVVARLDRNRIIEEAWNLALKWRCRVIGCEATSGFQHNLAERMKAEVHSRAEFEGYAPRVFPVTYHGDQKKDKGTRIADALIWRFEQNRVKCPHWMRHQPGWRDLFYQIENFTDDLKLLPHDDAIDALAMWHYVIKLPGNYSAGKDLPDERDLVELLKSGEFFVPGTRIPICAVLPPDLQTREVRFAERAARDRIARREPGLISHGLISHGLRFRRTGTARRIG